MHQMARKYLSEDHCFSNPHSLSLGSPEFLKRSVDNIISKLRGTKRLDLFECARLPDNSSLEEQIGTLSELISEGKFDYLGMSEVKAETLRRANAVCFYFI